METNLFTANQFFNIGQGIVTLCGSTKFFNESMELNRQLTFKGWIVLQCGSWGHSYHKYAENTNLDYELVKRLHYLKILQSQAIVVVSDKTGYIGDSTKSEIKFTREQEIPIFYYDGENLTGFTIVKPPLRFTVENKIIVDKINNKLLEIK